jgi:hypothetical protein
MCWQTSLSLCLLQPSIPSWTCPLRVVANSTTTDELSLQGINTDGGVRATENEAGRMALPTEPFGADPHQSLFYVGLSLLPLEHVLSSW